MDSKTPNTDFDFGSTAVPSGRTLKAGGPIRYTPVLVCFEGDERGKSFLITRVETLIGRSGDVQILLADSQASRRHARILYKNWLDPSERPECFMEDLDSRNGTELNGRRIKERVRLKELDRIQIGSTVLGFVIKDEHEAQLHSSLFEQATKDALTGLDNRRQFETQLAQQIQNSRQSGLSVALLIIDCDRFKNVNDTYGHDVGDKVLAHLAQVIKGCCRANEASARWGGEEFVVLLPDCSLDGARAAVERLRIGVETSSIDNGGQPLSVTVSIGGAVLQPDEGAESFFRRVDQQLYKAKQGGRNCVFIDGLPDDRSAPPEK